MKKLLFIILILLISTLFISCGKQIVYLNKVEEVYIEKPVLPDIPEVNCEFTGEPTVTINKMIECISEQKKILDTLREAAKNNNYQIFKKDNK